MAPIKFEEQIRQKLEGRDIAPSKGGWKTLEHRLESEKHGGKKIWWYLGIAASIIGVLVVTAMFFKPLEAPSTNRIVDSHQDVENNKNVSPESGGSDNSAKKESILNFEGSSNVVETVKPKFQKNDTKVKTNAITEPLYLIGRDGSFQIADNKKSKLLEADKKRLSIESSNVLSQEDIKVMEVVAKINNLQLVSGSVTDEEIDSLLRQAEKDILKQRIINETSGAVSANLLLQEVEEELDQSFRAKVFEALRTSYEKVKTAVAERND